MQVHEPPTNPGRFTVALVEPHARSATPNQDEVDVLLALEDVAEKAVVAVYVIELARLADTQPRAPDPHRASTASLRQRNTVLLAENRRLRDQIAELKAELAITYGQRRAEF